MTDYSLPPIGKTLVAGGLALATLAAFVEPMYPTIGFWLLAVSTALSTFSAYLGWGAAAPIPAVPIAPPTTSSTEPPVG